MGENMSRILIRTLLHQWIQSISDSPNREIRKMVDLSAIFAKGAFHQLIQTTRQILKEETSAYYALVQNLIQNTAEARLITYGVNLGYNCGICGAGRIRELKQYEEVHIPWSIALELPGDDFGQNERRYQELISQGEELGIYCWFLLPEQEPNKMLSLVQMHPDSAFTVICPPGTNIGALVDAAQCCNNLMVAVRYDSLTSTASDMLKDAGFLYSLYCPYNADTLDQIESGHLLEQIEAFSPAFCMFIPERDCPEPVQRRVHQIVMDGRLSQDYRMLLWEFVQDSILVGKAISGEGSLAAFDRSGNFHEATANGSSIVIPASGQSLKQILHNTRRRCQIKHSKERNPDGRKEKIATV